MISLIIKVLVSGLAVLLTSALSIGIQTDEKQKQEAFRLIEF